MKMSGLIDRATVLKAFRLLVAGCFLPITGVAIAQEEWGLQSQANDPQQPNDCVTQGSAFHGVNPWVVRAIIKVESNFNANAVNKNKNGTSDIGLAQINSMHFKELNKFGIAPRDLMDGCVSSYVAAWHLAKQLRTYGNTWFAIGAYHSATPCYNSRYVSLVWNTLVSWRVVDSARVRGPSIHECDERSSINRIGGKEKPIGLNISR